MWGFHRTFATGAVFQQRTLTPPDTWSCPTLGLASLLMLKPISPELVLFPDFRVSNISRYFCFFIVLSTDYRFQFLLYISQYDRTPISPSVRSLSSPDFSLSFFQILTVLWICDEVIPISFDFCRVWPTLPCLWWVSLLVDQRVTEGHVANFYGRLRLICSVWEHQNFPC